MGRTHVLAAVLIALILAAPAAAQISTTPATEGTWPWPPPDPQSWWDEKRPKPPEAADPLGGRRLSRNERPIVIDNGIDPLLYRLWGLPPLQNQVLRSGEAVLELFVRPSTSVRQSMVRVVVRRDGKAFVQARAGLGCCEPGIARRVGFDAELPTGWAQRLAALREDPLWDAPRQVVIDEGDGTSEGVCIDGAAYDLTLVVPGRSRHVRRACDSSEVGQAAAVIQALLEAAVGHEPRFDVLYASGTDFSAASRAYQALVAQGGRLKAAPQDRPQPPAFEPPPEDQAATPSP